MTASGERVQISDAEIEYLDEPVAVYNFEVMDWGTYYVSGMEVLVHNKCSEDGGYKSGLTQSQIDEILAMPKGSRPDPSTYLSKEYIEAHLALFDDGASIIMTKE